MDNFLKIFENAKNIISGGKQSVLPPTTQTSTPMFGSGQSSIAGITSSGISDLIKGENKFAPQTNLGIARNTITGIPSTIASGFTPRKEPVQVRRAFETTPIETKAPPVVTGLADFGYRLLEVIPKAGATIYGEFLAPEKKTGEVNLGVDARRFGFTEPKYQTASKEVIDRIKAGEDPFTVALNVGSNKTLDVAFGASLLSGMLKSITSKLLRGGIEAQTGAWEMLGKPKTIQQAEINYRNLAKQLHPDTALGSQEGFTTVNNAMNVLRKSGIPNLATKARVGTSRLTEVLSRETPLGNGTFATPNLSIKKSPITPAPISGYLPGYVSEQQGIKAGLSTEPVKPVGFANKKTTVRSFNDFKPEIQNKLIAFSDAVKNKQQVTTETIDSLKRFFEREGLTAPKTKNQLASQIDLMRQGAENANDTAFQASMTANLEGRGSITDTAKNIVSQGKEAVLQPRDTIGRFDYKTKTPIANITAPAIKTESRIIPESIPQKKGLLERAKDYYKSLPNKQGGFARVPDFNPSQRGVEGEKLQQSIEEISGKQLAKEKQTPISVSTNQDQLINPSYKESIAPTFNPDKYVTEQVAKRDAARISGVQSIIGKTKNFLNNAKAKLVDFSAPIEDVLNASVKKNKIKLLPEEDIHNQIDMVLRSPTLAGQFAEDNGLVNVIRNVDNINNLDQYLIAKHAVELDTRGIKTGRDIVKDTELVKVFSPKYEEQAKIVSDYSKKLLDYSVDSGLISDELANTLKKRYPDYVPFNRVFSEIEKTSGTGSNGIASLSKQTVVQRIEGSAREVESPIESLLAKTNDAFKQGEKNKAARMLAGYEKLPDNPFQLKEITGEEIGNKSTISFIDNGVKRTFETTPEVANAAKALNVQQLNILGKIFALPTRIARVGITGINIPFIASNIAKDQLTAFINSTHGLKTSIANPNNFVRSLFSAVKHDKLYKEMVRAGGAGTSFDISRNQVSQTVSRILSGKNLTSKIKYTVRHPSELLRVAEDIVGRSEEITRLQQFRGVKEELLKQGMNEKNATIATARQARDATVNFARRGEWGTVLNSAFLYLNASIQGTRTLLSNLKTRPAETAIKIAIGAMFPIAIVTTWNVSDKKRKEAYDDISDFEKENNLIIIPPNPTKDENGKWNVIKIPLSQEINNLVGLVRRPIESASGLDPLAFSDFAKAIIGTVSPIAPTKGAILSTLTPQIIKPTIEGATNTNLFTGFKQVPRGLEGLSPENQIKKNTSKFAIKLGNQIGVSPIKIDEFVKGTFGGVGSQITGQQSVIDAVYSRFGKASGGRIENRLYEESDKVSQQIADINYKDKTRIQPVYDEIKRLNSEGNTGQAISLANGLPEEDRIVLKKILTAEKTQKTLKGKREILPIYKKIKALSDSGKKEEALYMANNLPEDQKKYLKLVLEEQKKINK